MRGLTSTILLLGLPGCSITNPGFLFQSGSDGSGAGETMGETAVTTTDPVDTTSGPATDTSVSGMDGSVADASSDVTIDPNTTQANTTQPIDMGDPVVCSLIDDAFEPYIFRDGVKNDVCPDKNVIFVGLLQIGAGLRLTFDPICSDGANSFSIELGDGYPALPAQNVPGCSFVMIEWNKVDGDCKIGSLQILPQNLGQFVVLGAFTTPAPPDFPIQPEEANISFCGCPDLRDDFCCGDGLNPGEVTLKPNGETGPIPQSNHVSIQVEGNDFEFYNIESWMGPECADNPGAGRHIDWLTVALAP